MDTHSKTSLAEIHYKTLQEEMHAFVLYISWKQLLFLHFSIIKNKTMVALPNKSLILCFITIQEQWTLDCEF
jgi:hypothetical protein